MTHLLILAAIAAVPLMLAILLRVNALFVFISIAAGSLLVTYIGDDAGFTLGMVREGSETPMIARLALQGVPLAVSLLLLRKTVAGSKLALHILPMLASCLMLAVLTAPLLPEDMQNNIFDSPYGTHIRRSQDVIVGAAAVLNVLLIWLTYRHKSEKPPKGKK